MAVKKTTKSVEREPEQEASVSVLDAIAELKLEELVSLKAEVEQQIKQKQKERQKEIYANMLELAQVAGFKTVEEFVASSKGRIPRSDKGIRLPAKYRSKDGKKSWSGKGRIPGFVLEHEKGGGDREELLIK